MLFAYVLRKSPLLALNEQVKRKYNERKSTILTIPLCFQTGDPLWASPSELSQLVESLPELCTELRLPFSTLLLRPLCRGSMDLEVIEDVLFGTSGGTFLPEHLVLPGPSWLALFQFCDIVVCKLCGVDGDVHGVRSKSLGGVSCLRPHKASWIK